MSKNKWYNFCFQDQTVATVRSSSRDAEKDYKNDSRVVENNCSSLRKSRNKDVSDFIHNSFKKIY